MLVNILKKIHRSDNKKPISRSAEQLIITTPRNTEDIFIDYLDPCYCGSGKYFKSCCGSLERKQKSPFGIFIFENYLPVQTINEILEIARHAPAQQLQVIDEHVSGRDRLVTRNDELRVSDRILLGDYHQKLVELVKIAFIELAEKCFCRHIDWFESPDLLRYEPGGFYYAHADSENKNIKTNTWQKVIDRDISLLIYLNDEFCGGDLLFNKLNYRIRPEPGMAVVFPSDHRFMHEAMPVTRGVRYAIVSWASIRGVQKLRTENSESMIFP